MKNRVLSLLAVTAFVLTACGGGEEPIEETQVESVTEEVEEIEVEEEPEEVEEETNEIDESQPLENVGEYKNTVQGRVELIDIVRPTETYNLIDDVEINFIDIKLLHHSEIPENEKEFFKSTYGFDDEGHSLQFSYTVTNNTDETVGGVEIVDIVTSNGNQYNLYNHGGTIQGSAYEVRPNATANVGLVFSVKEPEIDSLDLYLQPLDKDGFHLDEKLIEVSF